MEHILIHAKGEEAEDIITALEGGVIASIQLGDLERLSEAPDGSGAYNFKIYSGEAPVDFDDLENKRGAGRLLEQVEELKESEKNLINSNKSLKAENEELINKNKSLQDIINITPPSANIQLKKLKEKIAILESRKNNLESDLKEKDEKIKEADEKIKEADEKIKKLKKGKRDRVY